MIKKEEFNKLVSEKVLSKEDLKKLVAEKIEECIDYRIIQELEDADPTDKTLKVSISTRSNIKGLGYWWHYDKLTNSELRTIRGEVLTKYIKEGYELSLCGDLHLCINPIEREDNSSTKSANNLGDALERKYALIKELYLQDPVKLPLYSIRIKEGMVGIGASANRVVNLRLRDETFDFEPLNISEDPATIKNAINALIKFANNKSVTYLHDNLKGSPLLPNEAILMDIDYFYSFKSYDISYIIFLDNGHYRKYTYTFKN